MKSPGMGRLVRKSAMVLALGEEQQEIREDPAKVAAIVRSRGAQLIGIDGCDGAGKTTLARALAVQLGGIVVDLDDHLEKHQGVFIPALKLNDVATQLTQAAKSGRVVIVSGLCLMEVFQRIGGKPDLLIYVQRNTQTDLPSNIVFLDAEDGYTEQLGGLSELDREIGIYHRNFQPRTSAHILFIWKGR